MTRGAHATQPVGVPGRLSWFRSNRTQIQSGSDRAHVRWWDYL